MSDNKYEPLYEYLLRETRDDFILTYEEIEEITGSTKSLMPDGLLAPLTPQEAADLLEYLATRK